MTAEVAMEHYLDVLIQQMMESISVDIELQGDGWDPRVQVASWLVIYGSVNRRIYVAMPFASGILLSALAVGMTADDVRADPTLVQDLAGEIANIIAGNLWPTLEGATGIGLPQNGLPPHPGGVIRRYRVGEESLLIVGLDVEG